MMQGKNINNQISITDFSEMTYAERVRLHKQNPVHYRYLSFLEHEYNRQGPKLPKTAKKLFRLRVVPDQDVMTSGNADIPKTGCAFNRMGFNA